MRVTDRPVEKVLPRKHWLDWQRGLAVLFMVEVHVLTAWLAPAARHGGLHDLLLMVGGFAAPGFLYMAGLSQSLADAALERKGATPGERRALALRRGFWLLGVAYGFRLVEYLVGGAFLRPEGWRDLLRVDVLNVIAVSLLLSAVLVAGRRRPLASALAAVAALAVVLATPVVADALRHYDLARAGQPLDPAARVAPGHLADVLLAYLFGGYPRAHFSLFNWSAFLLAGAALGPLAARAQRPWAWLGVGALLAGAGWLADRGPELFAYQNFWRTSPAWFTIRLGGCVARGGLLQLVPAAAERSLRWLTRLGRESLVAYIASVELTYGVLARPLARKLSLPWTVAGIIAMVGLTWLAVVGWERLRARRQARAAGSGAAPAAMA